MQTQESNRQKRKTSKSIFCIPLSALSDIFWLPEFCLFYLKFRRCDTAWSSPQRMTDGSRHITTLALSPLWYDNSEACIIPSLSECPRLIYVLVAHSGDLLAKRTLLISLASYLASYLSITASFVLRLFALDSDSATEKNQNYSIIQCTPETHSWLSHVIGCLISLPVADGRYCDNKSAGSISKCSFP